MKKYIIAAIAAIASMFNAATAAAQFTTSTFTEEGVAQMRGQEEAEEAALSRSVRVQLSNGSITELLVDGLKWGVGAGYAYSSAQASPFVSANVELDGRWIWSKIVARESDGKLQQEPVRLFSLELGVAFSEAKYAESAASAGQKYFCYEAEGLLKLRLFEDGKKTQYRHRLNLIGGLGYTYSKDDHVEDFGEWQEVGSGDMYHLYDNVAHQGSGLMEKVGLGYSFRPFAVKAGQKKLYALQASRIEFRVMATHKPVVQWRSTTSTWGVEAGVVLHLGGKVI
jgi:hypothetical protein